MLPGGQDVPAAARGNTILSYWVRIKGAVPSWTEDVEVPETFDRLFGLVTQTVDGIPLAIADFEDRAIDEKFVELLSSMVTLLGTDPYPDLWAPTPGNLGAVLARILELAQGHVGEHLEVKHVKTLWAISHEDSNPY